MVGPLRDAWRQRGFWHALPAALLAARVAAFLGAPVPLNKILGPFAPPRPGRREAKEQAQDAIEAMLRQPGGDHGHS